MADHTYTVTIDGHDYEVSSPAELTDVQAYHAAKQQADRPVVQHNMPVDPSEPGTYLGGVVKGFTEGATEGVKGFAEGVVPGVISGAKGLAHLPIDVLQEGVSTIQGLGHLADDPSGTIKGAVDTLKGLPTKAADAAVDAAKLGGRDPRALGREIGKVTGNVGVGVAASKLIPTALRPAARQAGPFIEAIGKKGQWPIRMMGAHQLGSGNPAGLATLVFPEALQKGGAALTAYGEADPAYTKAVLDKFHGGAKPVVAPTTATPPRSKPDLIDKYLSEARPEEKYNAAELRARRSSGADVAEAALRRQATPAPASIEDLLKQRAIDPSRIISETPGATKGAVPLSTVDDIAKTTPAPAPPIAPVPSHPTGPNLSPDVVTSASGQPATAMEAELTRRLQDAMGSKSRRGGSFSANDVESLLQSRQQGLSPEEAIKKMLADRAARSQAYRDAAGMDKGARLAAERDKE